MELLNPKFLFEQAQLAQGMKVADLGCGNSGLFVFSAGQWVGEKGTVYAVDVQKSVLEHIKSKIAFENVINVVPIWTNLEIYGATKIPSESLDLGMLISILHQSEKKDHIVKESVRMIKSGGKLLIVDWKKNDAPMGPPPERRLDKEALIALASQQGLTLEKEFEAGPYHFGLIFLKPAQDPGKNP